MKSNASCAVETVHHTHRICWSAIVAGALVGVGLAFLLHIYGRAIHLSAYSATENGAAVIAIGGLLGMLVGAIAAMATAGFVSGYLGRFHYYSQHGGVVYGFITWSLILMLSAAMIMPMSHFVSVYEGSLTQTVLKQAVSQGDVKVSNNDVVNARASRHDKTMVIAPSDVSAKALALSSWIMFAMFFIGALSCCVGASYGIRCKREMNEVII